MSSASPMAQPGSKGHPAGLYLLFLTEMWERFSYYGMRGLLILFLTKSAAQNGLGINPSDASLIYGYFTGFVYFTPIIGGWLADNFLGQRLSILIGGVLMALGQFSLASGWGGMDAVLWQMPISVIVGLFLLMVGNGFFKPNISTIVGKLYPAGDSRKDSAFTIFYMGINTGALIAPLVTGFLAEDLFAVKSADGSTVLSYGFQYGFLAAGIGMTLGQILFNLLAKKYLGDIGVEASKKQEAREGKTTEVAPLTKEEKDRMTVIFIITIFVTFFWAGFEQAGSSLSLYTDKFINRQIGDFLIPTSFFQSVNPLFIILLGGPISAIWVALATRGKNPSTPIKMGLGMILLGIGYFFMVGAVLERGGDVQDTAIKAGLSWLIFTYLFHTLGELMLSPIGLSMITKLSPTRYTSMMMGVWFLSPFVAQILGGYIAKYVEELGAYTIFIYIGGFVIGSGALLLAISPKLKQMMHGAETVNK